MAHSNSVKSDDELIKLVTTEHTSSEIEVPVEFERSDTRECVVCIQKTLESYEIYTTPTIASGTLVHTFLSKYSHKELIFASDVNKYICSTCLQLVNVLEHAEIQYVKLKSTFEAVISKNPLFRSPQSIRLVCEKEGTRQEGDYDDTGPYSGDDPEAMAPVGVKIERNSEDIDEDINYGGLENFVDTVMEPDPLDDDASYPEDATAQVLLETLQGEHPTSQDSEPYECQICHRRFVQKYHLIEHEIVHTGREPFQCTVCLRSYNRKAYLQNHIQRYHAGKLFQCDHCPETFIKTSELRTHMKKHIGEPFKCETCNCEFKRKDNYQRHLKTHSVEKERPFECPICQKRFVEKPHLRNHLATHTGEKPFVCTVCECWFNRKGNLQRHMRRHTGEKPFECEACQRRFAQKLHLLNHIRRKHINKPVKDHPKQNEGSRKRNCKKSRIVNGLKNKNEQLINATKDN